MKTYADRLAMLADLPPGVGAEIGVQRGVFSRQILDHTKVTRLHLIDPWQFFPGDYEKDPANISQGGHDENYRHVLKTLGREIWTDRARIQRMGSLEAAALIENGSLGWAYLDAKHDYDSVLADLLAWAPNIALGGALCGHDFTTSPEAQTMGFGVYEAVMAFTARGEWKVTAITEEQWPSLKLERV